MTQPTPDILWLVHAGQERVPSDPRELDSSAMASQRLRVAMPAAALARLGARQHADALRDDSDVERIVAKRPSVLILSKMLAGPGLSSHVERHERLVHRLRQENIAICIDVCDNYFETAAALPMRRMLALADAVTANSEATAGSIAEAVGASPIVIPDPVEGARGKPRKAVRRWAGLRAAAMPSRAIELLWFGGPLRSFQPLAQMLPALASYSSHRPLNLHLVTAPHHEVASCLNGLRAGPRLAVRFTPWSREALADALDATDLVLLPSDPADPSRTGASANRLIESLWAGRYAVASGVPSYWEFKDCASIGEDLIGALDWAIGHPAAARDRILRGQSIIEQRYTPERIGAAWWDAICESTRR